MKNTICNTFIVLFVILFGLVSLNGFTGLAENNGEVLKVRSSHDIQNMDPAFHFGGPEYNINLALFSRLMKYKPGSQELTLDAAKSVDLSEDGKTLVFELKRGIQFHEDYGELTAEDVKFSYERIIDPENDSPYKSSWRTLDRVEVTGKYSGKLIFNEPLASLFTTSIPYSAGAIISKKAYNELGSKFSTHPIGSGPYRWKNWSPSQKIVLERFDKYYGEKPDFEKVEIFPIEDTKSAEMAFDGDELDITNLSMDSYERYKNKENAITHETFTVNSHFLGFNVREEPFNDIRVRKAIRYAINSKEIIDGAYNGVPKINNCLLPGKMTGSWENCPTYEQNLGKARELLQEAGYSDGFEVSLIVENQDPAPIAAQIIQQQLLQIGINAKIKPVENGYQVLKKLPPETMHYYFFGLNLNPGYWFEWFTCDQVGKWNFPGWCNEKYDKLLKKAATTLDREDRAEIFIEMQRIMHEEIPFIPVTNDAELYVTQSDVEPSFLANYLQFEYFETKKE